MADPDYVDLFTVMTRPKRRLHRLPPESDRAEPGVEHQAHEDGNPG